MPRRSADSAVKFTVRVGAPWAVMTVILVLLHGIPGSHLSGQELWMEWRLDLLLHAFLFGMWSISGLIALRKAGDGFAMGRQAWIVIMSTGIGLAFGLEWAQSSVFHGRGGDFFDGIADVFGLISGGFAFRALYLEWPVGKRIL